MDLEGLPIVDMEPDGNCLFRAVSHQLYGDAESHLKASAVEKEKEKPWHSIPRTVHSIIYCSADAGGIGIGIGIRIGGGKCSRQSRGWLAETQGCRESMSAMTPSKF